MKLSIIIPVYNTAEYLPACLDSVIYPGLEDYEIIIVNDGSTDNSSDIAAEYVVKYPELIKLINKENGGLGDARNAAIEPAEGEFLLFLDSDDKLCENAVPELLQELNDNIDMLIYDIQPVTPDGIFLEKMPGCKRTGMHSLEEYPELIMEYPSGCNKVCRKSIFVETGIRFPGRAWYEDLRTMPKLYLHTDRIYSSGKTRYLYLIRPGSITNSSKLQRHLEIVDAIEDLTGYYKAAGKFEEYHDQLEYTAFYHQFLTASVRVCVVDSSSPLLLTLKEKFLTAFPEFSNNKYIKNMSRKHRLLSSLLIKNRYKTLAAIMKLNDIVKHK